MTDPQPAEAVRETRPAHGPGGDEWTEEQLGQLAAVLRQQATGRPRLLTPLPWQVRLHLAVTGAVDRVAVWLVDRDRFTAAARLWRAAGMMRR